MITAKISSKCQITLPRRVRQALDVSPGERVAFVLADNSVVLQPLGPSTAKELAGSLRQYASARKDGTKARSVVKKEVARAAAREG